LPSLLFSRSSESTFPTEHQIKPSPPNKIAIAIANQEKMEKEKGPKWDAGLIFPGMLDVEKFDFNDVKLGVVFEDEEMVSRSTACPRASWRRNRRG
jgi:hypothetical protein